MGAHESHPDIVKRLKRAEGHLRGVIAMIEEERPCLEIAQQLHAVEAAVINAKKALIHDHLDHCLDHAEHQGETSHAAIHELREITRYL